MKDSHFVRLAKRPLSSVATLLIAIIFVFMISPKPVQAAPFGIRFTAQPPSDLSSASRFSVTAQLYDQATGLTSLANGVTITLRLLRCPGYPGSCSIVAVDNNFASDTTTLGSATFSDLVITSPQDDYYFVAQATGYNSGISNVFDVEQAVMRLEVEPTDTVSSLSRLDYQAVVRIGTSPSAPIDTRADNIPVRMALYRCPGYPASCSVVVIDTNFANATMNNGVASLNNLVIGTPNTDYYFYATTPGVSGITGDTSTVIDVVQAVLNWTIDPDDEVSSLSRMDLQVEVLVGPGGPRDLNADSVPVRLALYRCPGYPASCSVVIIDTNYANGTATNGIANFFNVVVGTPATDYYFYATTPGELSTGSTSNVFDVVQAVLNWTIDPDDEVSSLSRMDLQVEVLVGPGGPRDLDADSVPVRLALYRCPGYPASCSVVIIDTNYANGTATNGIANFSNVVVGSPATDYYFYATTPSELSTGSTSNVFDVVQAVLRWTVDPPDEVSSMSRMDLQVEVLVGPGGPRDLDADSVPIRLALYRCPGYPASCSVVIINTNYANGTATNGVANFSNVVVGSPATDYYFYATTPSEIATGSTSNVFDVVQAVLRWSIDTPDEISNASRMDLQVEVLVGPGGPVDTDADNVPIQLALYRCPGYPASCSVVILNTNFANANAVNGVVNFNDVVIDTPNIDYYFYATTPSEIATGSTSNVFDVAQAYMRFENIITNQIAGANFPVEVSIRRGSGVSAPIDTLADGVDIRLTLYRCPGYPASCSVVVINTNFANATTSNGSATFPSLSIGTPATDYYFFPTATNSANVSGFTSSVFDVVTMATVHLRFTIQGRPAPPNALLAVPIHVVLTPNSGAPATDTMVAANSSGEVTVTNLVPGIYSVWIKYERALAVESTGVVINSGSNIVVMGELRSGDANNNNIVNLPDFSLLSATYGISSGDSGYDERADFNGDGIVNLLDFSLLSSNYGEAGDS